MNYQELVDKCKKAYADKDLKLAWQLWEELGKIIDKLDEIDIKDDEKRNAIFEEYHSYTKQFTDEEVFGITDYGKQKAYREMEFERTRGILDKSISLYDLTKDDKMKSLDDFLNFYEWCILKSDDKENMYMIYDLQTNEIKDYDENNGNKTLDEVIDRVVGRAVDYETNESEYDEYIDDETFEYFENLYDIAKKYTIGDYDLWLKQFRQFIDDFKEVAKDKKICLVCGREKEDYQSAYCDKCWEEEKERIGVED